VAVADLADGDLIQGGQTVLRVTLEEDSAPAPATPAAGAVPRATPPAESRTQPYSPVGPLPASCPVCAAVAGWPLPAVSRPSAGDWPLCPACRDQVCGQPQPFSGYQLVRELGRGAMGVVHLALRTADGAVVALKRIKPAADPSPPEVERFLREADILRRLDH